MSHPFGNSDRVVTSLIQPLPKGTARRNGKSQTRGTPWWQHHHGHIQRLLKLLKISLWCPEDTAESSQLLRNAVAPSSADVSRLRPTCLPPQPCSAGAASVQPSPAVLAHGVVVSALTVSMVLMGQEFWSLVSNPAWGSAVPPPRSPQPWNPAPTEAPEAGPWIRVWRRKHLGSTSSLETLAQGMH